MLVLSRKTGERIHIGDDIFIEVRKVAGNRVTIAIEAPKKVRILRGELMEAAKAFEEPSLAKVPAPAEAMKTYVVTHRRVDLSDVMTYSI